jgi:tetratricopeptide (TPR) repeat protein
MIHHLLPLLLASLCSGLQSPSAVSRRTFFAASSVSLLTITSSPSGTLAADTASIAPTNSDTKQLFNQARALEQQGNLQAAQRLYEKIVQIAPDFVYGWSNLGNTQTAFGQLAQADESYSKAIQLCTQLQDNATCQDLYLIHLNRGSLRLNNHQPQLALVDLIQSNNLRARPDAVILPNLARAYEVNHQYALAADAYATAIRLAGNTVTPFWLRASLVDYQLDRDSSGYALLQRVSSRFPDAPEVKAATALYLWTSNSDDNDDKTKARQVFLEIPNKQRLKFSRDNVYLDETIAWPPKAKEGILAIAKAVGDLK